MIHRILLSTLLLFCATSNSSAQEYEVLILGNAQDGGYPQIACEKECCQGVNSDSIHGYVSSLAIINRPNNDVFLIDCSPDIKRQWTLLSEYLGGKFQIKGIFLTHAHVGHYTGLQHFGREVLGGRDIPVFCMPRMKNFIENNGPWSQLVLLNNIRIYPLQNETELRFDNKLIITPFEVPHRDEFSETVGFKIKSGRELIFIPDIDKWEQWDKSIVKEVQRADIALLDGTFYDERELPGRDMSEIPHPFIIESMEMFEGLRPEERKKILFIHLNHSNPLLRESDELKNLKSKGFDVAKCSRNNLWPFHVIPSY
jgi:pyrroloquinoline quinone biosynthesis protein B